MFKKKYLDRCIDYVFIRFYPVLYVFFLNISMVLPCINRDGQSSQKSTTGVFLSIKKHSSKVESNKGIYTRVKIKT